MGNGEKSSNSTDKPVSIFRTRKAEVISGLSVATLIALYGFARNVVKDFHGAIEAQTRIYNERVERIERQFTDAIKLERDRNKEDIQELKQRIVWIERELNRPPKIAK